MARANDVFDQMKVFSLAKNEEGGGLEQQKSEVTKRRDIVAKCLLSFDGFLSVSMTDHQDLDPELAKNAQERERKAVASW
jgi:hypothetical protein